MVANIKFYRLYSAALLLTTLTACGGSNASSASEIDALKKRLHANMVFVQGGTFTMGDSGGTAIDHKTGKTFTTESWTGSSNNRPVEMTLSDYSIAKYIVTWENYDIYRKAVGKEPYLNNLPEHSKKLRTNDQAAMFENWQDARDYCQWAGKQINEIWDLPTEAQWEYAARDRGERKPYANQDGSTDYTKIMNGEREPVGAMAPNKLGLYQMNGHMGQFVYDWYWGSWPNNKIDYSGPTEGKSGQKVFRGGHHDIDPQYNNNYARNSLKPEKSRSDYYSWRCAKQPNYLP